MSKSVNYRPDIDGLRAVAVISVLLAHVGFDYFSGGYIGVDVFFVISGFLITKIITQQVDIENFSFKNFYVRRVRRLFPAMCVTIIFSFVLFYMVAPPQDLERIALSGAAAIFSLSNIFFSFVKLDILILRRISSRCFTPGHSALRSSSILSGPCCWFFCSAMHDAICCRAWRCACCSAWVRRKLWSG